MASKTVDPTKATGDGSQPFTAASNIDLLADAAKAVNDHAATIDSHTSAIATLQGDDGSGASAIASLQSSRTTDEGNIASLLSSRTADETAIGQLQIALRYVYALEKPAIHMEADYGDLAPGNVPLTALGGGASQGDVATRLNLIKSVWNSNHLPGVGTVTANGEHKAADAANVIVAADATGISQASCSTLEDAIAACVVAHGNQAGVHFSDDTGTGGATYVIPHAGSASLANDIANANSLLTASLTHFGHGTAVLPWAD